MSDGDCMNPVHRNIHPRFSQADTHCRECGGHKWRWREGDAMPRVRLLCETIAAHERGRNTSRPSVRVIVRPGGFVTKRELTAALIQAVNESSQRFQPARDDEDDGA